MVLIPGLVAVVWFLVFTYFHAQTRADYFRAWQLSWGAYCLYYVLDAWSLYRGTSPAVFFLSSLLLIGVALCILVSTRLLKQDFHWRWYDTLVTVVGVALASWNLKQHMIAGVVQLENSPQAHFHMEWALAVVLLFCSFSFYRLANERNSIGYTALALALAFWGVLLGFGHWGVPNLGGLSETLGPVPQMVLGIAMLMVLFENDRRAVQENALAFSTLGVDATRLLDARELVPSLEAALDRLLANLPTPRAVLCISEKWRTVLPSVQRGFTAEFLAKLESSSAGDYLCELTHRHGGFIPFRNLPELTEPLPAFPGGGVAACKQLMLAERIHSMTAVSLQTREYNFGVLLFPHAESRFFASSHIRLLIGLTLQIGLTLENYVVTHLAHRRTKEYELLTQIGQVISSQLDQDQVLRAIQKELGRIFDTSNFYIAFQEGDEIRFELEVEHDKVLPKRARQATNGITEYVIRTGQSLLIRSNLEKEREKLGVTFVPTEPALCLCAAPIFLGGKPAGAMVAMSTVREFVFEQRDLEVMRTAAGQVSVAVENARLFAEEQRRSRQLSFLNNISKIAISSEDAEQMLADIVTQVQKNFNFDHIGIGILDYVTQDIEIKAEAGSTAQAGGKRVPLGVGILGRVARSGETALVQSTVKGRLNGLMPESRAVLCIPVAYGETLLGVLNVESQRENAFTPNDVLIMSTLAGLLATALHNSFVFQKLQQQSITDGLTGIKTRRFFMEALSSEWKRASRSGRPFSVVLMDLDKFKEVNDTLGHLEGDLVLARVGRLLEQKCRQSNVVARFGGDEFIILMPETAADQAQILAERLRLWVATDSMLNEHRISGSFGVASFPIHGFTMEEIIRVADAGMYVSKHAGGNRVSTAEPFSDDEDASVKRQLISSFIEGFLQRDHTGPEHAEEVIATLQRICGEGDACNVRVLKEAIETLSRAAESRELHASGHGDKTARCAEIIAHALDLLPEEVADLTYAARVHDAGKLFLPERLLNKSGPLSEDEFYLMKLHPQIVREILATIPNSSRPSEAAAHHHEAFDGSGYPGGLRGEEIPLLARILAIADAFANMTAERSFAPARSTEEALTELERHSGVRYDGMLVRVLIRELKTGKNEAALRL